MYIAKRKLEWLDSLPDVVACADCGKDTERARAAWIYETRQLFCPACASARRENYKHQLAALPRCIACKRRGTRKHNGTYLCGRHWKELESVAIGYWLTEKTGGYLLPGAIILGEDEIKELLGVE
jgi:hypothetical protein